MTITEARAVTDAFKAKGLLSFAAPMKESNGTRKPRVLIDPKIRDRVLALVQTGKASRDIAKMTGLSVAAVSVIRTRGKK